ncbi:MAG: Hsp33 family molecular chaperone HslO [Kiritimatiellae bacterium]|nr:Hsp33 family molecular chaperone HslO [Kiritimatiellia bacterium]
MEQENFDNRQTALTSAKLALTYVNVTNSAAALERSHLCGATAGLVQSKALAAVALLGAEVSQKDETVSLRLRVSGPVAGVLVENAFGGSLRGYTHNKVLNTLDVREEIADEDALGELAQMSVIRSIPGKTISSAMLDVQPASVKKGLHEYLNRSLQRTAEVEIAAESTVAGVTYAKAFMAELMPDGNAQAFKKLSDKFADSSVLQALTSAQDLTELCALLKIEGYKLNEPQQLQFKCRCSTDRVEAMVSDLPDEDLEDMLKNAQENQIICHMCGTGYRIGKSTLWNVLEKRGHDIDFEEDASYYD